MINSRLSALLLILVTVLGACSKDAALSNNANFPETGLSSASNGAVLVQAALGSKPIKDAYIVVLNDNITDVDGEVEQMTKGMGGAKAERKYKHALKGFSIKVPAAAIQGLLKNPKVKYIEQDQEVSVVATQTGATWGLDRLDQAALPLNQSYTYASTGSTVDAYIFDTGIRTDHTEFTGRILPGYFDPAIATSPMDGNGHGTHVAGTVGGTTYGIAKGIKLVPVKVLGDNGSGSWSGVIAGVDWAVGNHASGKPAVGNMSLGGGYSLSVNDAVKRAVADGIVMCVAAGNSNSDAAGYSPASTADAITVGATTSTDARASYSNFGSVLDIFAPGSAITSAWYTSSSATNTISGTSMASPHVAGVAALYLEAKPGSTPAQVEAGLKGAATRNIITNLTEIGSPNLLLNIQGFSGGGTTPAPAPAAPTLLSPSNNATGRTVTNSAFSWNAASGATSYTVELSTSNSFSSPVQTKTSLTTTSTSFSGLSALTTYYWRVGAVNASGTTWSTTWMFTTALAVPGLLSPANAVTGVSLAPTLTWSSTGAASYDIEVATRSNFTTSSLVVDRKTSATSVKALSLALSGLKTKVTYYWRVRSRASNGTVSSWAVSRRFTTQ